MQDPAAQTEGCGEALSERGGGGGLFTLSPQKEPRAQGSTPELSEVIWSSPLPLWHSTLSRNMSMTPNLNLDPFNKC